jgi:hypothetical protein
MSEYVVAPDTQGWRVSHGGADRGVFPTKEEAFAAAMEAARTTSSRVHLARVTTPTREVVVLD